MYMMTQGNSKTPLIKLSEGYSIGGKNFFTTIVCGSNGEPLKPVRKWEPNEEFVFYGKEKLNAEFISKTELIYIKTTYFQDTDQITLDIVKYKVPKYLQDNKEVESETVRKTKPDVEQILVITLPYKNVMDGEYCSESWSNFLDGKFNDAIIASLDKFRGTNKIYYFKES